MRTLKPSMRFRAELRALGRGAHEEQAVLAVLRELADPRTALPRPEDGPARVRDSFLAIGWNVPGTDLVVAYLPGVSFLPGIEEVPVLALLRAQ